MGTQLPPGWPHTSTNSKHFLKGGGPPSANCNFIFCLVPTCFDDILMVFWWYFYGILMIILSYFIIFCWDLQAKNCPPPPNVSLFDAFVSNKTEENALKCTIPQEKAFPYGRSQKLTPPQNVLLFDAFFLKEYTENALKSQNRILTWTFT